MMPQLGIAGLALLIFSSGSQAEFVEINYQGFTVWVDCDRRSPVIFHYILGEDTANNPRHSSYDIDPNAPAECQSTSTDTFQSVLSASATANGVAVTERYDVGHQVPANHFDSDPVAIRQTNFWTNLAPQTASMNRGAWLETEFIIECLRDEVSVEVWGGPIWAGNAPDDFFVESHGIQTPSAFWKVAIRTDTREAQGWIITNGHAPASTLDEWLQPIGTIEAVVGHSFNVADRTTKPETSWAHQNNCHS